MSSFTDKERFDYYWKHFSLIADQRVKTFNFYVIVVGFTLVATIQALNPSAPLKTIRLLDCGHIL
jgi:hypothetical protein